jgi:hypothetical protein
MKTIFRSTLLIAAAGLALSQDRQSSDVQQRTVIVKPGGAHVKRYGFRLAAPQATNAPTCSHPKLTYYGGPLLSDVQIVIVNWSSDVDAGVTTNLPTFYSDITSSSSDYWGALSQYSTVGLAGTTSNQQIVPGGLASTTTSIYTLFPSRCPAKSGNCRLTDDDIQSELTAQINAGFLPGPATDSQGFVNTVYIFNFPPLISLTGPGGVGNSCQPGGFCAYHNTATNATTTGGPNLIYAALMDEFAGPCNAGCGTAPSALQNYTSTAVHELIESVTDTDIGLVEDPSQVGYPAAWFDNNNQCGEIADICDNNTLNSVTINGHTWNVQGFWSNKANACIVSGPPRTGVTINWTTPAPIASGTALSTTQLDASVPAGSPAGVMSYNHGIGEVLPVGNQTLTATYTPSDLTVYTIATDSVTLQVVQPATVVSYSVVFGSQSYNLAGNSRNRLPWQITGLQVVFSKAIANATSASLGGVTASGLSGVGTTTLTWTFSTPLPLGSYTLTLAASGANAITDSTNIAITATGGLALSQAIKVLTGDVNDDGVVNASDLVLDNNARAAAYNLIYDINGDGVVNATDVNLVRANVGKSLP